MLRRTTKLIIFFLLVGSIFMVLHKTIGLQQNVEVARSVDIPAVKETFLSAIQKNDLGKAKLSFATLQAHLPPEDDFIQTIAPAYMADLYIQFAKRMSFNKEAEARLLAEARALAPEHPYLTQEQLIVAELPVIAAELPKEFDHKLIALADEIDDLEHLIDQEEELLETELAEAETVVLTEIKHLEELEKAQTLLSRRDELTPAMAERVQPVQAVVAAVVEPDPIVEPKLLARPQIPYTNDACALAFYTRDSPLGACVDAVAKDYYGPALFVIADENEQPSFAFTQAPVSVYEYELFCHLSGQCYKDADAIDVMVNELQLSGIELDLTEVQQTVTDYNRYCQMTHLCETIETPNTDDRTLSKGEMQRYALWLTKETGNKYRLLNDVDSKAVYEYFQYCMQSGECSASMLEQLAIVFKDKNLLLVREL